MSTTANKPENNKPETTKEVLVGFFQQDDKNLEKALTKQELNLDQYSSADLCELKENGGLKVEIPQFTPCTALISKSVSTKNNAIFYSCVIYISNPYKYKISREVFTENAYMQICLDNDLSLEEEELQIPVRVRFVKGYSKKSLSSDKSFYAFECLFPGNDKKLILRDFLNGGDIHLINLLSKKSKEECAEKNIEYFNNRGLKLYILQNSDIDSLNLNDSFWDLYRGD